MTIDGFLVGAWTRARLVVDGAECVDRCQTLWLQTPDCYADVRMPCHAPRSLDGGSGAALTRPRAFGGYCYLAAPGDDLGATSSIIWEIP